MEYTAGALRPFFQVEYSQKYTESGSSTTADNVTADPIFEILAEYLPKPFFTNHDDFVDAVKTDAETFKPLGEKIAEYTKEGDEHYEIYKNSFSNAQFREYHSRMQLFVLFFIEGSSYIEDDDEKWEIYTT